MKSSIISSSEPFKINFNVLLVIGTSYGKKILQKDRKNTKTTVKNEALLPQLQQ